LRPQFLRKGRRGQNLSNSKMYIQIKDKGKQSASGNAESVKTNKAVLQTHDYTVAMEMTNMDDNW
jgi:hypothetical protein